MHLAPQTSVTNETDDIPVSTRWHRAHGRQTRRQRAIQQQLLTPAEEKALVDHVLRLYRNGRPARVKHLRYFARTHLQRRAGTDGPCSTRLPGKDWPQAFYKRHPELQAARSKAIDWQRHSPAKLSVHDFIIAIEHVLSVSARIVGKLDFVSMSIWRWTRTLSIVGYSVTGLRRSRSSTSYTAI